MQSNDGSQKIVTCDALKDLYKSFVSEYPIVSIEDPFDQDDWEHYSKMTTEIVEKVQLLEMISWSPIPRLAVSMVNWSS